MGRGGGGHVGSGREWLVGGGACGNIQNHVVYSTTNLL